MIDTQSGDVRYAIIGSGGQFDIGNDLVAVPWSAVEVKQQVLTLNRSLSEMRQAPRFSEDRLAELTQPSVAAMVYNYYLVPEEQRQQGNQGQQGQPPQQSNQQQQHAQQRQQSQQSSNQGQQQAQTQQPHLLVGRDIVTMLLLPALKSTREVRGTDVMSMSGQEVGSIDKIMIDTDHGHIAYILLDHGSFLGIGGDWLPVPYDAMQWSTSGQQYTLSVADRTLQQMPKLPKQDLPTTVKASQLQAFYDQYGITPYWQQMAQTTQMEEPAHGSMSATVQTVNDQQGTVTLKTSNGNTVEFEASQEMLSNLQAGDSVEVSIRPTSQQQEQRSGTQSQ
jgi:sporulation protein YlmC with PRC-barrel domain